uniref:Putative sumo ligase n=1 Tax=Schistosoma mansoni TaxID=6183 RepID=A0A3Q0KTB8_SCHMA
MRQTRDHLELKAFIQRCRRADLDKLIKLTNLPRGGLKQDIQLRLISYLDQDPSTEFLSALNELRGLMYNPVNFQFQQSNGNFDPHCPSSDIPASLMYLRDSTIRCPTESSKNSGGPNSCLTGTKISCSLQKEQLNHNPYVVQPNINVFGQSSPDELDSTKNRQQKSQQTDSSDQLPQSPLFPGNPVINPSVWSSWESVKKLLPENRVTISQSCTSGKSQNLSSFNPHSQTNVASSLPILSNSAMSDGHSKINVHSECPQSSIHTHSTDSRKATVTHKIGQLITLAGVDGSFRLPAVLPGFHFKESPFFKLIDVLLPPQIILPAHIGFATGRRSYDRSLALRFTSDQVETITYHCWRGADERMEFGVQVIMRFARLDPQACQDLVQAYELYGSRKSSSLSSDKLIQIPLAEDSLPVHLIIQVNGRPIQLPPLLPSNRPGMDGRRNPRPINITQSLHVSPTVPNYIKLTWTHDYSSYTYNVVGIYLMRRRSPQQLCGLLHSTSFQNANVMKMEIMKKLSPNATTGNIGSVNSQSQSSACNENDDDDDDLVMPNTLPVQLLCPLSKCRIEVPVRGRNCRHVQCYDATTYLIINERKPTWNCPVCDGKAVYEDLIVDGLFLEILNSKRSQDLEEIIFHSDGSWSALGEEMTSNQSENTNCNNDNNADNSNSKIPSELSPCTDYNQLYSLQESPYASSHITSNSIRSTTDSAGSSSFVPSFNTLSPASSINSLSNTNNSYPNTLSMSPALTVRAVTTTPLIRNDVDNISVPNTTKTTSTTSTTSTNYQTSVTVQSSRDKEQNQHISQEISSFTIDLTLSDDENEQQGISSRETASSIQVPTKDNNSSSRPVNTVTSHSSSSSSSSSLSPQFPPSDLSQSSHYSESNYQPPFSLHTSNRPSSITLSSASYSKSCNQSISIPPVYSSESNSTQSVSVSQNLVVPNVSVINASSNQRRYPPVSSEQKQVQGPATNIPCSVTQSDVPVSLPSIVTSATCGGKRPSSSDYNFSSLNFYQSGTQSVSNNNGSRCSSTVQTTSISNESSQYSYPTAKVPRIEIPHSQHYGSSSTQSQGSYSNNNSSGYNSSRRYTNSPSGSNPYTYHSNITRQMPSDGYHSNRLTSSTFHSGQSSDHFYHNEHTPNASSRYSYYNPNESGNNNINNANRTYCYYPSSRHASYPTSDSGTIYPHNRQLSSHIRGPYETHHRNVMNNTLPRDPLHHNSQMRSSDMTNSTYCGNSVDSRRGFH